MWVDDDGDDDDDDDVEGDGECVEKGVFWDDDSLAMKMVVVGNDEGDDIVIWDDENEDR